MLRRDSIWTRLVTGRNVPSPAWLPRVNWSVPQPRSNLRRGAFSHNFWSSPMASKRKCLKPYAVKAFKEQSGCCIYCDKPMWLHDPEQFSQQYRLAPEHLDRYQCTGEHLVPHSIGGKASRRNIVAAHRYCNQMRHAGGRNPGPLEYRETVQQRVKSGTWLRFPN